MFALDTPETRLDICSKPFEPGIVHTRRRNMVIVGLTYTPHSSLVSGGVFFVPKKKQRIR